MGKIILVTGGARSGKSSFAERYVAKYGKKVGYIATSKICDEEMEYRVKLHRERRPAEWETFESPYSAHEVIREQGKSYDMFLFDCMTIYVSNILSTVKDIDDFDGNYKIVTERLKKLITAILESDATVVIVTNEVGSGIVPNNRSYLESLPGVGRKTANVVLKNLFNEPCIPVDTHVIRVTNRLGIVKNEDNPLKIEKALMRKIPKDKWNKVSEQILLFGRYHCKSINPECEKCLFQNECKWYKQNK